MSEQANLKMPDLANLVDRIIDRIHEKYPDAFCLMSGDTYGDEDVDIEIYVPEDKVLEVDRFAHETSFELTQDTGLLILPMVAPMESCPVKR